MNKNITSAVERALREAGFVKREGSWYLHLPETILVANIQKSNFGDQYYVNLAVCVRELGGGALPKEHKCHIRVRLGALAGKEADKLLDAEDLSVSDEEREKALTRIMETEAIPFLRRSSTIVGIREMMLHGRLQKAMVHKLVKDSVGPVGT